MWLGGFLGFKTNGVKGKVLGQSIYEEFIMERGVTRNDTLLDYKMPRSTDIPNIRVIDIITDDPDGPFGAKEASEGSIVSTPSAIFSALHDATGVWFKEQPVTPEKVVKALKDAGKWMKHGSRNEKRREIRK